MFKRNFTAKNQYLWRRVYPKKWGSNTIFDKNGRRNQIFCMQLREMETKKKKDPCFAQARYLLAKLCNIFDEAFLFDVSIV